MTHSPIILESERLQLREFVVADAPSLFQLYEDPEVMRYTGEEPFVSVGAVEAFIREYPYYRQHGFGRWAVLHRQSGEFMGFCGLRRDNPTPEVDLGFRFFRQYWFKGYATEAARASMEFAFKELGWEKVIHVILKGNERSIAVAEKLGSKFIRSQQGLAGVTTGEVVIYGQDAPAS